MKAFGRGTGALGLALVVAVAGGAWGMPPRLQPGEESVFAVPRLSVPPILDGAIGASEWQEAVAVSGPVDVGTDLLDARPATFFLAWDAQHLYMACRAYLPAGYKPRLGGGRVPDGADCFDDGLECLFKPMGQNVSNQNHATEFKFNLSCLGHGGTYTRLVVGQIMKNWEPKMRTATRITASGTAPAGGTWWELETAFSLADFELVGEHQSGDQWCLMLGLNHLPSAGWMQARIPCVGGYFTPQGKSIATLVENTPAVQMTMDTLSNLATDGTAALAVSIFNPAKNATQVKLDIDVAGQIARSQTLELPAGGQTIFRLDEKLPAEIKEGRFSLRATQGQNTLLAYLANFQVGRYNRRLQPVPDPDPHKFAFTARFNPVGGRLEILADSYMLPAPEAVRALVYEVRNKTNGKRLAGGEITEPIAWRYRKLLDLQKLRPGTYEATAHFALADGTTFGPQTGSFTKKDEAKEFAHWWGKDTGNSERVLPPFEAIRRVEGEKLTGEAGNSRRHFTCWGRAYAFDALGLPTAVISQGEAVLAAPARLVVTVGGQETVIPAGQPTITEQKAWRVRFRGRAEGAGLVFSTTGWMEQDGMVAVDLTYAPKGKLPVKVDALRIEYPVANEVAECLVSVGPGANFAAMTATVLPTAKQGRLWSVFDTGRQGSQMQVGSFYPHVWLGGDRRGFQWWADSDRGWFPDDDVPAHEVVRVSSDPAAATPAAARSMVVLRNHIIGKPVELGAARTLAFTWIATPFKPLPKGWRQIAATDNGTFGIPHRGVRIDPKTNEKYTTAGTLNWINPESYDPADWGRLWHEQKTEGLAQMAKAKDGEGNPVWKEQSRFAAAAQIVRDRRPFDLYGARTGVSLQHMSFQLIGWGRKSMESHLFDYFGEEWQMGGDDTWNASYTDYAMYLLDRAFGEGGVVSTYWDLAFPILFGSPLAGLAYPLPDGRWQPGYNSLNCRRFFQRLWAVQDTHGLNPGAVGTHSTQSYLFPVLPWIDAVLDGERDWNLDASEMDWIDYYPKERMRAMSSPHNWGVGICWMSNYSSQDKGKVLAAKTAQAEYLWLHDSWINPYMAPGPTRMPTPILDWGLNAAAVTYHPYWRNPAAACPDPDILVSLWQLPDEGDGRVLVGLYNYDRQAVKAAEVKLDLAALGLAGQPLVLRDLYPAPGQAGAPPATFDAATGVLRVAGLGGHRGRFVGLAAASASAPASLAARFPPWIGEGGLAGLVDHGFAHPDVQHFAPGQTPAVTCAEATVQIDAWQLPDRLLLAVYNGDEKGRKNAEIQIDLEALGLTPTLPWQDFVGLRQLAAEDQAPAPVLDFYGRRLILKAIPANRGRLIVVRRY